MRKIISLAILMVMIATLLCIATPALASPPVKVECYVEPVIGGPNNPHSQGTPATVTIPANNPAIRLDPTDIMPGNVFVPVPEELPPMN